MKTRIWKILNKTEVGFSLALTIFLLPILSVKAEGAAGQENIDVNVIVNVVGDSNAKDVNDTIEEASKILSKALSDPCRPQQSIKIRLVIVKKPNVVKLSDGDDKVSDNELNQILNDGTKEAKDVNGFKIYIANNCRETRPNWVGWGVALRPVSVIESTDPCLIGSMGRILAHEIAWHNLGNFKGHKDDDPCSLGHPDMDSGTSLTDEERKKILDNLRKMGKSYFVKPQSIFGQAKSIPPGIEYSIDAHGTVLDNFFDVFCEVPGFNPRDPNFTYADLQEINMFWDEPLNPDSKISLEVQLGGLFPVETFFDISVGLNIYKDEDTNVDARILMEISDVSCQAHYYDLDNGQTYPLDMVIHNCGLYDVPPEPIIANCSLEVAIPANYFFGPGSEPFEAPVYVNCNLYANDEWLGGEPMTDETGSFEFSLTQPFAGPQMQFISTYGSGGGWGKYGIAGSGFVPASLVDILIDGRAVGTIQAKADGTVMHLIGPVQMLEKGMHECVLSGKMTYSYEQGSVYYQNAIGYFNHSPCEAIEGDLDKDCDVDFYDLAIFASHWLECNLVPPETC